MKRAVNRRHLRVVDDAPERPRTRADCELLPRPCPLRSCRYHLAHEMPHSVPLDRFKETCSLDVADRGEHTLAEIAEYLGGQRPLSRERIRQIVDKAMHKLMRRALANAWRDQIEFPGEEEIGYIPGPLF